MDEYRYKLGGVDGERVWVSRAYNYNNNGQAIRQLRETFFPLDGVISVLYQDGHYLQYSVQGEWWDRFWNLAMGDRVDYFARLETLVRRIRDDEKTFVVHESDRDYRTRFGQPFYPSNFGSKKAGGYVGEKPHIKDRSYTRFMFRPGHPPSVEQYTPNVIAENRKWLETQLEARARKEKKK